MYSGTWAERDPGDELVMWVEFMLVLLLAPWLFQWVLMFCSIPSHKTFRYVQPSLTKVD